jgi:hypothetical protein
MSITMLTIDDVLDRLHKVHQTRPSWASVSTG